MNFAKKQEMLYNLKDLKSKEIIPGFSGQFIHGEKMTMADWTVEKGAVLPEHSHVHEQISRVVEGEFEMTIETETFVLKPGMVVTIQSNATHSGVALTNCKIIDIFSPSRPEYNTD